MTEEAQPSPADDRDSRPPEAPEHSQPDYHVPTYGLPTDPARVPTTEMAPERSTVPEPGGPNPAGPAAENVALPSVGPGQHPSLPGSHPAGGYLPSVAGDPPAGGLGPVPGGGGSEVGAGRPGPSWVPPPPREAWHAPRRVETVPGTPFGTVHLEVPPMVSGLAIGALVAGIASVLVSFLVVCFGLAGAAEGWGAWAAGAFALLGVLSGGAAIVLGLLGLRQIRRVASPSAIRFRGRGLAIAGLSCGGTGLGVTVLAFLLALLLQAA
ncbi:hypothetical protein GCM10027280_08860 [Micromonospora polyrhachis]|uniref:Uncharacterized protein n=1 Tax=Micromonospora polyrhachis TaxID=1282883 RepID=A0A7W7SNX2_9ACTN|nr:phage holin family protein [Micromonospora polyrhachis]MBB4958255.1 hypothetical protein [Micromonospora polyrhachis]